MKYVVVGTSHFGYEAVQTILKNEPNAEIHLYERGAGASFMGWGSQSYLDGTSKALSELHFANEDLTDLKELTSTVIVILLN